MSEVYRRVCPEVALDVIAHVPKEMQLWPSLTLMFWNATTVTVNHVDVRDLIWSLVLLFGTFTGGDIDLPYLNTKIQARRADMYLVKSNKVFYNVDPASLEREVLVFTNHKGVIQRFCKVDTFNLFSRMFK